MDPRKGYVACLNFLRFIFHRNHEETRPITINTALGDHIDCSTKIRTQDRTKDQTMSKLCVGGGKLGPRKVRRRTPKGPEWIFGQKKNTRWDKMSISQGIRTDKVKVEQKSKRKAVCKADTVGIGKGSGRTLES